MNWYTVTFTYVATYEAASEDEAAERLAEDIRFGEIQPNSTVELIPEAQP